MFDFKKCLDKGEDAHLMELLKRYDGSRDVLVLKLLRVYGMRASELLAVRVCDLDVSGRRMRVIGLKGSLPRNFPLRQDLFDEVHKIAKECSGPEARLFPIGYSRLGQIWRMYRPVEKPLHSLRHTCAVEMYQKKKDLLFVRNNLGHKSIASTMIYQHAVNSDEENRRYFCGKV